MNAQSASNIQSQHLVPPVAEAGSGISRNYPGLLASVVFVALLCGPFPALAQTAPPAGVWQQFGALGNSGVTGSTGAGTVVSGDVGSSPTPSITNFPPSSVAIPFTLHTTNDLVVQAARTSAIAAYTSLFAQGPGTVLPAQLDGAVLTTGIYSFAGGAADLAALGTLTLNGGPTDIFVFQVDSALTANVGSNIIGTADPCNVYWRVGTSATLNGISFRGTVIADASITVGSGSNVTGRVLAGTGATGAVTMAGAGGNTIGGCSSAPASDSITVNKDFIPNNAATVSVALTCTSGIVTNTPLNASEATPAVFTVSGASPGATCTATETVPPGYTANQANCVGVALNGSCTIINTLIPASTTAIPTLSEWAMIVLAALLAIAGFAAMRRRAR